MPRKLLVGLAVAILASTLVLAQLLNEKCKLEQRLSNDQLLQIGQQIELPQFVIDVQGNKIELSGYLLFLFFDSNCGNCVDEAPLWDDFYARIKPRVRVVGISREEQSVLENFIRRIEITYPVISDPQGKFFEQFLVEKIPYALLLNKSKIVVVPSSQNYSPSHLLKTIEDHLEL